jgi:hypothetical protein
MTTMTDPDTLDDAPPPWERQPGESARAFRAFAIYRDAGPSRSLDKVGLEVSPPRVPAGEGQPGRKRGSTGRIREWCRRYAWVERAKSYDDHLAKLERTAKFRAAAESAEEWARRRQEAARDNWERSRRLAALADTMLAFPVAEEEIEETDDRGRPVRVTRRPGRWTFQTAAVVAKTAAELSAAALVEGTAATDDGFDPATASPQELRDYLERMGVKRPPAAGAGRPGG